MKEFFRAVGTIALVFIFVRGLVSFFVPVGMDCYGGTRSCAFGPGIVGQQECWGGKWAECKPTKCEVWR